MKCVIFAGGLGTRLSAETVRLPKPMVEINGKPILWHIMSHYSEYGIDEFIILAGYKQEVIKDYFINYYKYNSNVIDVNVFSGNVFYRDCHKDKWNVTIINTGLNTSTGGRLLKAKDYIEDNQFMLTYGDGVSDVDIDKLVNFHNDNNSILTLTSVQSAGRFGSVDIAECGVLNSYKEKPSKEAWINAGFMVCEKKLFDHLEDADFSNTLEKLADMKLSSAYKHYGLFKPIDTLKDKYELEAYWKGVC